jgi:hypothetical protein
MKEILPPSLLPYLQSDKNHFRLEISLISRETSFLEKSPFPFLTINESTPFERLLEAKILTDADNEIRRVFLLQQSDDYRHVPDEVWPLTNADIDQRWIKAVKFYSEKSKTGRSSPILLAEQIAPNGVYAPFQPLLYCALKDVYFHPPCPQCGDFLQLCCDDMLLAESNLTPYTTSLRRYLYCPKCLQGSGNTQFYSYSRAGNDPATLKDRRDLLNDFGNLILKSDSLDNFPCLKCPELTTCYGTDNRVMSRIVPFSFYPFHLLIFEADTLSASDFLALISGASFETLKANLSGRQTRGRLHCLQAYEDERSTLSGYLFGCDSDKGFLEILFLKLSFLGELIGEFFSDSNRAVYCDASLSLDRVWVRLADQAGLLPQFWNFNISILDIWSDLIHRPHLSKYPPAYGQHFLGTVWFYALLVNDRQSVEKVRAELDKYIPALGAQDSVFSEIIRMQGPMTVFAPENIFWYPDSHHVAENWHALWNKSLDMGAAILAGSFQAEHKWSPEEFWQDYKTLRTDIRNELFGQALPATPIQSPSEAPPIADILNRLLVKWRREIRLPEAPLMEEEAATVILPGPQERPDLAATVILSPSSPPEAPVSSGRPPEEEETLILPSGTRNNAPTPKTPLPDEELIQETVILSPGRIAGAPAPVDSINPATGGEDLPETIVLSPGARPKGRPDFGAPANRHDNRTNPRRQADGENSRRNMGDERKEDASEDDDILTETVILRPQKHKGSRDE